MRLEETFEIETSQSTNRGRYFGAEHVHDAVSYLTAVQLHESLLCDAEARAGDLDHGVRWVRSTRGARVTAAAGRVRAEEYTAPFIRRARADTA
jgi:hypothetical protein